MKSNRSLHSRRCDHLFKIGLIALALVGCEPAANQNKATSPKNPSANSAATREEPKKASSLRAMKLLESGRFDDAWEE